MKFKTEDSAGGIVYKQIKSQKFFLVNNAAFSTQRLGISQRFNR